MRQSFSRLFLIKSFFIFSLLVSSLNAQMIDAIALTINEEPITLSDISNKVKQTGLKEKDAVSSMIDEILYKQEIQKQNINVDIFEVNDYIEKIAASNGMDLYAFKSILRQKNKNIEEFENETKKEIIKRKLVSKIVRGNLAIANEEDLKIYYNNNQKMFTTASIINIVEYKSKNKRSLNAIQQNPMAMPNDVEKNDFTLTQDKLNSQLRYLLNETNVNNFTPIFTANKTFAMFYIKSKEGVTTLDFKDVKEKIFNILMTQREQKFLKEYFEKLKLTANIKVLR